MNHSFTSVPEEIARLNAVLDATQIALGKARASAADKEQQAAEQEAAYLSIVKDYREECDSLTAQLAEARAQLSAMHTAPKMHKESQLGLGFAPQLATLPNGQIGF